MTDEQKIREFGETIRACERCAIEAKRPWKAACFMLVSALASMVWLAYAELKEERRI